MSESDDAPIISEPDFIAGWLEAIESASAEEKDWRTDADKAVKAYRGDREGKSKDFNIYHSNIETIVPALYNSPPVPDVRRRYLDDDPVGKAVADLLERALGYSIDTYDFDGTMLSAVKDMAMAGRGLSRVRYQAQFADDDTVAYEKVCCEYVPWRSFRHGPAVNWDDVPWIAFEHFLSKQDIERNAPDVVGDVPFDYSGSTKSADDKKDNDKGAPKFGKRARVWEIWDKDSRRVDFICPDFSDRRLWTAGDPLGLEQFFPIPRPMQAISTTDSLVPITSYSIYEDLIAELNDITRRISRLVKACRARGWYAALGNDIISAINADDAELTPITGAEGIIANGGDLNKAISWFPLDTIVNSLEQLIKQREVVKQTIYEVTKIADVMRGATNPNETASAQNLKAQWGSLSIQRYQAEVARFARDLFRIKAEVIANKFSMGTLVMMTGVKLPFQAEKEAVQQRMQQPAMGQPQPGQLAPAPAQPSVEDIKVLSQPSREEVEQLLKNDAVRGFQVDIESDSTIRGDLQRSQQQWSTFLQGVSAFAGAIGPFVEKKVMPAIVAIEMFSAMCRTVNLGKQAEDALDQWADQARKAGMNAQQEQPDPKIEAEKVKAEALKEKTMLDVEAAKAKHGMGMQKMQAEAQLDKSKIGIEQQRLELDMQRMSAEQQNNWMNAQANAALQGGRPNNA